MKIKTYCSDKQYILMYLAIDKDVVRINDQIFVNIKVDVKNCNLDIEKIQLCIE